MKLKKASLIISASERDSNLYYATRFLAPDPVIYVEFCNKKYLILSDLEVDRAGLEAKVDVVLSLTEMVKKKPLVKRKKVHPSYSLIVHNFLQDKGIRNLIVPSNFPSVYYESLKALGYRIQIKSDPFYKNRLIKTPLEKKYICATIRCVEKALYEAVLVLEKSKIKGKKIYYGKECVTSELLRSLINSKLAELFCVAQNTIVASGIQSSFPHHEGCGPIWAHTPIIFDIFPRHSKTRYWGDMSRTLVKGKPSPEVKKMFQAVKLANQRAMQKVAAGVHCATIHKTAMKCLEEKGFKTGPLHGRVQGFIHSTGHGLGLDVHEHPSVSPQGGKRLKRGNVITIEPGLYYEKQGGVRIEDDVYVTANGFEKLTKFPTFLEIDRA